MHTDVALTLHQEFVFAPAAQSGFAFLYAVESLRQYQDIVWATVAQNGRALLLADLQGVFDKLEADRDAWPRRWVPLSVSSASNRPLASWTSAASGPIAKRRASPGAAMPVSKVLLICWKQIARHGLTAAGLRVRARCAAARRLLGPHIPSRLMATWSASPGAPVPLPRGL